MRRPIRTLLFTLALLSNAESAAANDLSVRMFVSNSTHVAPELNAVVFNSGNRSEAVVVDFGISQNTSSNDACLFRGRTKKAQRELDLRAFGATFGAYESIRSTAIVPPHGFVHRYYPYGVEAYTFPCSVTYGVFRADGSKLRTGEIEVDPKVDYATNAKRASASDISFSHIVEKDSKHGEQLLATLMVKNTTEKYFSLRVVSKRLVNCEAGFDFEHSVRQGVDGSLVTIEPHGVGFILTSILLDVDPKPNKRCRLRVAVSNVDDEKCH